MSEMPQKKEIKSAKKGLKPKKELKIAKRSALPPFLALEVMRKATELAQAGEDIVHLEVGQPSSSAPDAVNRAMMEALKKRPHMAILLRLAFCPCANGSPVIMPNGMMCAPIQIISR